MCLSGDCRGEDCDSPPHDESCETERQGVSKRLLAAFYFWRRSRSINSEILQIKKLDLPEFHARERSKSFGGGGSPAPELTSARAHATRPGRVPWRVALLRSRG